MDDLVRTIRRTHILLIGVCVGVILITLGVPRAGRYLIALDEVRALDRANLAGWNAHALRLAEEYERNLPEWIREAAAREGLTVDAVRGGWTWFSGPIDQNLFISDVRALLEAGGAIAATFHPGEGELRGFFAGAADSLRSLGRDAATVSTEARRAWCVAASCVPGASTMVYTLTVIASGDAQSNEEFRYSREWALDWKGPGRTDVSPGASFEVNILTEWLKASANGQTVAEWFDGVRRPLGIFSVYREIEDRSLDDAIRYLEDRAAPGSSRVSVLGLSFGAATAGWVFAALVVTLLLFMTIHLRQLLRVPAERRAGAEILWIGFFPDRMSQALTLLSLFVLPVGAIGAYLFIEALTYGSMFMPWDPLARVNCCSPVRVSLAFTATGILVLAAGHCSLTLRRVRKPLGR